MVVIFVFVPELQLYSRPSYYFGTRYSIIFIALYSRIIIVPIIGIYFTLHPYCITYRRHPIRRKEAPQLESLYYIRRTLLRPESSAFPIRFTNLRSNVIFFIRITTSISADYTGPSNVGKGHNTPLPKSEPYCCGSFRIGLPCHLYTGTR